MSDIVISVENLWKQYRYGVLSHRALYKDLQIPVVGGSNLSPSEEHV